MAKRGRPAAAAETGGAEQPNGAPQAPASDVLGDFAADLGKFLGGVQSKATSWLQQRKDIADQLTQIRDTANQYLQQLAGGPRVTTPSMLAKEVAKREAKTAPGQAAGKEEREARCGTGLVRAGRSGGGIGQAEADHVRGSSGADCRRSAEALGESAPGHQERQPIISRLSNSKAFWA